MEKLPMSLSHIYEYIDTIHSIPNYFKQQDILILLVSKILSFCPDYK
jgi:hypothetical protein